MVHKPSGNPPGRPSLYTPEKVAAILELYSGGKSLANSCVEIGLKPRTFITWVCDHDDVATAYARARTLRALLREDEIDGILDDGSNDYTAGKFGPVLNSEHIKRSELRSKRRQEQAERWLPVKLGGKVGAELTGNVVINFDAGDAAA